MLDSGSDDDNRDPGMNLTPLSSDIESVSDAEDFAHPEDMGHLGYSAATDPVGSGVDTALDEQVVTQLYDQVFGRLRVSLELGTRAPEIFTAPRAMALAGALASSVPMTRAMGRESARAPLSCLPHLSIVLAEEAVLPSQRARQALEASVREGRPLSPADRAALLTLPDLHARLQWTLAWLINRCRSSMPGTRRAAIPIFFRPLGRGEEQHANLIALSFSDKETLIELFEPNGVEFYSQAGLHRYLEGIETAFTEQGLLEQHQPRVHLQVVGRGTQTALGEWKFRTDAQGTFSLQQKGYPVCGAVCVWAFSRFLASEHHTLGAYDSQLYAQLTHTAEERHLLQREFQDFLRDLAQWLASPAGRESVAAVLSRNFRNSNVERLTISRPGGGVDEATSTLALLLPSSSGGRSAQVVVQ